MHRLAVVMRKLLAGVALVLIAGVFPAMANLGLCAARPCCRSHERTPVAIGTHPACCNETNCSTATAKPVEVTQQAKNAHVPAQQLMAVAANTIAPAQPFVHELGRVPFGSPPTQQRLAALSILLI